MTDVTGLTAPRMLAIEAASVVDGHIDGSGHLILEKHDGSTIDAGSAIGPQGIPGSAGSGETVTVQQGITALTDGALTRNSATSITIAAGTGWVKLASGLLQKISWASTTLAVRNPVNSALDQVVVDSTGTVSIQQGTDVAGVTLTNRTSANDANINSGLLRLWDLNPTSANVGISATGFRDRRPWARGARVEIVRFANGAAGNDFSSSSGSFAFLDATNLNPRVELTGARIEVKLNACVGAPATSNGHAVNLGWDGSASTAAPMDNRASYLYANELTTAANAQTGANRKLFEWVGTPVAGSHTLGPVFASDGVNTPFVLTARANIPVIFTIKEIITPSNANLPN